MPTLPEYSERDVVQPNNWYTSVLNSCHGGQLTYRTDAPDAENNKKKPFDVHLSEYRLTTTPQQLMGINENQPGSMGCARYWVRADSVYRCDVSSLPVEITGNRVLDYTDTRYKGNPMPSHPMFKSDKAPFYAMISENEPYLFKPQANIPRQVRDQRTRSNER